MRSSLVVTVFASLAAESCSPAAPTACDKSVRASSLQGLQKISLGTHSVNETLTFKVPPSTGSITVVQQAVSATSSVVFKGTEIPNASVPHRLTTPAGLVLYDDTDTPPADGHHRPDLVSGSK